jgi:hypothetical protein
MIKQEKKRKREKKFFELLEETLYFNKTIDRESRAIVNNLSRKSLYSMCAKYSRNLEEAWWYQEDYYNFHPKCPYPNTARRARDDICDLLDAHVCIRLLWVEL